MRSEDAVVFGPNNDMRAPEGAFFTGTRTFLATKKSGSVFW